MARAFLPLLLLVARVGAATVYSQALRVGSAAVGAPNVSVLFSASPLPLTPDVLAWAEYNDTLPTTGWATLALHTREGIADSDAAYAAGYLEGATTTQRSWEYIHNAFPEQTYEGGLGDFIHSNFAWVRAQVAAHPGDAYWHHVGLVHEQWEGLYAGYSAFAPADYTLDALTFYSSTLSGDLDDLNVVFPGATPPLQQQQRRRGDGHCSVLIKAVGTDPAAPAELLASHTTWSGFSTMTRIYKLYDFPWTVCVCVVGGFPSYRYPSPIYNPPASQLDGTPESGRVPATRIAFSSYPAALFSDDDWCADGRGEPRSDWCIGEWRSDAVARRPRPLRARAGTSHQRAWQSRKRRSRTTTRRCGRSCSPSVWRGGLWEGAHLRRGAIVPPLTPQVRPRVGTQHCREPPRRVGPRVGGRLQPRELRDV